MTREVPGSAGRQFLESLDSTRMTWNRFNDDPAGAAAWDVQELQVLFEVFTTLAFGRTVVVPQSYALDSFAFTAVAAPVLRLRDQVATTAGRDRPFRLCMTRRESVDRLLSELVLRTHDSARPFVSSLYPELHELSDDTISSIAADLDQLVHVLDDGAHRGVDRADALHVIRTEFRQAPGVVAVDNGPRALNRVLRGLAHVGVDADDDTTAEVHARLVRAVDAMLSRAPDLDQRSWVHADRWSNDPHTFTRDVIGDGEADLVREFVDTAYNCLLARSSGAAAGGFSTDVVDGADLSAAADRAAVQRLALLAFDAVFHAIEEGQTLEDDSATAEFGVTIRPGVVTDGTKPLGDVRAMVLNAVEAVLSERSTPRDSAFWRSASAFESATASGDAHRAADAFEAHLDRVTALVGATVNTRTSRGRAALFSVAGGAGSAFFSTAVVLPPPIAVGLGAAAAGWPYLKDELSNLGRNVRGRRHWSRVLANAVTFRAGTP